MSPDEEAAHWLTVDQALVAAETGIALEELRVRESINSDLLQLLSWFRHLEGAGSWWIQWDPFGVVLTGTADVSAADMARIEGALPDGIAQFQLTESSFEDLEQHLRSVVEIRDEPSAPLFDAWIEHKSSRIVLSVNDEADLAALSKALDERGLRGSDIRIDLLANGISAPTIIGGGNLSNGCSSSFIVRRESNPSVYGPLSAGHSGCNVSANYLLTVPATPTNNHLPLVYFRRDSSVQRLTSGAPEPWLRTAEPNNRLITGRVDWAAQGVDDPVCRSARASGYTCGRILTKTYSPSYVPSGERFVRTTQNCQDGDSGGSHLYGTRAYGVQSGRQLPTNDCLYGAINYALPGDYYLAT